MICCGVGLLGLPFAFSLAGAVVQLRSELVNMSTAAHAHAFVSAGALQAGSSAAWASHLWLRSTQKAANCLSSARYREFIPRRCTSAVQNSFFYIPSIDNPQTCPQQYAMLQHKLHTRAKLSSATFGYVAESAFGPWAVRAVDGCILISLLGCVVLYLISLATIW
jgi:hypothetical protein